MLEINSENLDNIKKLMKIKNITENELFDNYSKVILNETSNNEFYYEMKKLIDKENLPVNKLYELLNNIIKLKKLIDELYNKNILNKKDYNKLLDFLFWIKKWKISISNVLDEKFFINIDNNDKNYIKYLYTSLLPYLSELQEIIKLLWIDPKLIINYIN